MVFVLASRAKDAELGLRVDVHETVSASSAVCGCHPILAAVHETIHFTSCDWSGALSRHWGRTCSGDIGSGGERGGSLGGEISGAGRLDGDGWLRGRELRWVLGGGGRSRRGSRVGSRGRSGVSSGERCGMSNTFGCSNNIGVFA